MKIPSIYLLTTLFLTTLLFTLLFSVDKFNEKTTSLLASVFFQQSVYTEDLVAKYDSATSKRNSEDKIKIMIVPGHDDKNSGAYANNTTEAEINLEIAKKLKKILIFLFFVFFINTSFVSVTLGQKNIDT